MSEPWKRVGGFLHRQTMMRWRAALRHAAAMNIGRLKLLRSRADMLRSVLGEFLSTCEARLASTGSAGENLPFPPGTDWNWRPSLWRQMLDAPGTVVPAASLRLDHETELFHDCPLHEMSVRQTRSAGTPGLAPFAFGIEVYRFEGSYLSLVLDLPQEAARELKRRHLVRVEMNLLRERPGKIFARLNVRHGPNTEQLVHEIAGDSETISVEFDLAYTNLNEKRAERMWLDLIFDAPAMNRIVLRDLKMARYPRAEL